jgi:hypothetical protein
VILAPAMTIAQRLYAAIAELQRIIRREPIELAEVLMAAVAAYWGLWLLHPYPSMTPLAEQVGDVLTRQTEGMFGAWFVALALFKLGAIGTRRRLLRQIAGALLLASWAFVAMQFHNINPWGTGVAAYSCLVLVQAVLFARQARRVEC